MPLQYAPQQRIAPPRDRSPVHQEHKQPERLAYQAEQTVQVQIPLGQPKPQKSPQQSHKTPLRERMLAGHVDGYDGPSDRRNPMPQTTIKQAGPMRAGSELRRPFAAPAARTAARPADLDASSLKLEVPNTLQPKAQPMKHQMSQSTDASGRERVRAENQVSCDGRGAHTQPSPMPDYDNENTSATFDRDDWDNYGDNEIEAGGEPTAIHRPPIITRADVREEFVDGLTMAEVHAARAAHGMQGNAPPARPQSEQPDLRGKHREASRSRGNFLHRDDTTALFGAEEDRDDVLPRQIPFTGETPSKPPISFTFRHAGKQPVSKKVTLQDSGQDAPPERASSPLPNLDDHDAPKPKDQANLAQYRKYGMERVEDMRRDQAQRAEAAVNAGAKSKAPVVSKVPESQETSEDEQAIESAQVQPNKKRSIDEIDYDFEKLKTMSYAELDTTPFLSDPRAPATQPRVDSNGTPISLEQRLSSLSRMNVDDQKSLFQSLTDAENEEAGQWFVQSFANDLKRLMEVRLERRKKALTFENEAKKRQKEVETKSADLDRELAELKQGGSQLIEGRSSPRPAKAG